MGLFDTRYRTVVGTSVSRVIQDEAVPDSKISGVLKAIISGGSMAENIMEDLIASVGVRGERMYDYAKEHYTNGLPGGTVFTSQVGVAEVTSVLRGLHGGADVLVDYVHIGAPNALHFGWMAAIAQHGYNPTTNKLGPLSAQRGVDVFMEDMVVIVPQNRLSQYRPSTLEQWGTPPNSGASPSRFVVDGYLAGYYGHTPVEVDPNNGPERIAIKWIHTRVNPSYEPGDMDLSLYERGTILIPFTGPNAVETADYFHVKYTVGGQVKYWMYQAKSGGHPSLDQLVNKPAEQLGSFFPFAYFRFGKQNMAEDTGTEEYRTTKKMVKYLGIDFDEVADAINQNPEIGDVEQAMLVLAVPANTEDPQELAYLYTFFDKLFYSRGQGSSPLLTNIEGMIAGKPNLPRFSLGIEDKKFKMALSDAGIYKARRVGTLGPVGSCHMDLSEAVVKVPVTNADTGWVTYQNFPIKTRYYRKQTSGFMYDEITVVDLQMMYEVLEGYATTADEDDDILLIPIDHAITEDFSIGDRERLYARSMHFIFNASQVQKIKWYQTGWFRAVMVIVAIVIVIFSYGSSWETLAAALATGSATIITVAAMTFVLEILKGILYSAMLKLFVKEVGLDIAIIVAIIAAFTGYYQYFMEGGFASAPWAKDLLGLSSNLVNSSVQYNQDNLNGLADEYAEFQLLQDEAAKQLEAANDLLNNNVRMNPFVIFGESPDDFYNRTVHSGNIGVVGISAISQYVETALTLPKLSATIGET